MNRAERIYRLHEALKRRRPVPLERLKEELDASRATVVRDLAYLRDFFRAPVRYEREANGYTYAGDDPGFELPGLFFNESELFALLAAERILESVQPGILAPRIGPLKSRIRQLLTESGHDAGTVAERVQIRPVATRYSDPDRFATVATAVLAGRALAIAYHGRARDRTTERRVHCARLIHYRANWYLLAWCDRAEGLRLFSLERIREAHDTGQHAEVPADAEALDRFVGASFGIFSGEARHWARIRFTPEIARWVAEESWHSDQLGYWADDGRFELQVPYSDPRELLMEILRYTPEAEVIEPAALRRQARDMLEKAVEQYGKAP